MFLNKTQAHSLVRQENQLGPTRKFQKRKFQGINVEELTGDKMAIYEHYDYKQMRMIPPSLENQLRAGTLGFAIHTLVENRFLESLFSAGKSSLCA